MIEFGIPALIALFVWWFSTGVVLYLDGLPSRTFKWTMAATTAVSAAAICGLAATADDTSLTGTYMAFACGVLVWAWLEVSFYTGYVTGLKRPPCPEGCKGWAHFGHAIQVSLWHELAILAVAAVVAGLTWGAANTVGLWTFVILWWMHQSAKLNVFLGVRNLNEDWIPDHLAFLRDFLTRKSMNLLFPVSVTVSTVAFVLLVQHALTVADPVAAAGTSLLAALMFLAIAEHWFLVLPVPFANLWRWSLRSRAHGGAEPIRFDIHVATGFLGAGKTTFMRQLMSHAPDRVKTVALVNDFSELGVDASLLADTATDIVELPNGCICCSLREDLGHQLSEIARTHAPDRVIVEPSGAADLVSLVGVLDKQDTRALVASQYLYAVIDCSTFVRDYNRMPRYFQAQSQLCGLFILNKSDLVTPADLEIAKETLGALNPAAILLPATFGAFDRETLDHARKAARASARPQADSSGSATERTSVALVPADLQSWSTPLNPFCDAEELGNVLNSIAAGSYGDVERVKGIARTGSGWVHFDLAGGRSSLKAISAGADEQPRVVAIGRGVDTNGLEAAFEGCADAAA